MRAGAFYLLLIGVFIRCEPDVDPCPNSKEPISEFIVTEFIPGADTVFHSDTLLSGRTIVFKALGDFANYRWEIGEEPRVYETKEFQMFVGSVLQPQALNVKLFLSQPLNVCPKYEKLEYTLEKTYVLVEPHASLALGSYRGSMDGSDEEYIVEVIYCNSYNTFVCTSNINIGCRNHMDPPREVPIFEGLLSYRSMRISNETALRYFNTETGYPGNNCNDPVGWLFFDSSANEVVIEYTTGNYSNLSAPRTFQRFIGKRL